MPGVPPERIRIVPDDHHAEWVGRTPDGMQFFATTPFVYDEDPTKGREFVAVFLWDSDGNFAEARIDEVGTRAQLDNTMPRGMKRADSGQVFEARIAELGEVEICPVTVAPFQVEELNCTFGLIYENSENGEWVELTPGYYMGFLPPWTGDYDT